MIKLLVSSFYNTLIDEEDAIPTSTMFELDRVREQNIKFAITTNNLEEEVLYYNQDYPFIDYIISLNGSILHDLSKDKWTFLKSFTKEELDSIEQSFPKKEIYYYTKDSRYSTIPGETVYKVEIVCGKKKLKELPQLPFQISYFQRNKEVFLEIGKNTPYEALKEIIEEENISEKEVLGIIGNDSEEEILNHIENIYVVRNSSKELKGKTKKTTTTNKNKGVENVTKKEIK